MKKIAFILIAFVSITICANAEGLDNLFGQWEFADIPNKDKLDKKTYSMLTEMFKDMKMDFNDDSTYLFTASDRNEEGTFVFDGTNLTSTDDKGRITKSTIKFLPGNQILFTKGSMAIIFSKVITKEELEEEVAE